MKSLKTIALSASMLLVTVAAMILINPIPSLAITCWTNCADGSRASCSGDSCEVTAGQGVTCTNNGVSFGVNCDAATMQ